MMLMFNNCKHKSPAKQILYGQPVRQWIPWLDSQWTPWAASQTVDSMTSQSDSGQNKQWAVTKRQRLTAEHIYKCFPIISTTFTSCYTDSLSNVKNGKIQSQTFTARND